MHKIFSVVVYVVVLTLPFTPTGVVAAVDSSELRTAVTIDGVRAHQFALQDIADANAGNRAENTAGFSASSDYVRDQLIAAGYAVTFQSFDTTSNLIAELPGDDSRLVIAGAHLDSVAGGPGIQDNGSGAATILEIALQIAALGIEPANRVRFVWWGAEETTGNGTQTHLLNMPDSERNAALYLNFDMLGSPNGVRFVYDGDGSDSPTVNPDGSAEIEQVFLDYFSAAGQATLPSDFSEHPALPAFRTAGVPVGGLFGGASGIKTVEEVVVFGGTAGDQYDPCHHLACDTYDNISLQLLDEYADAAAHAILYFAVTSVIPVSDLSIEKEADASVVVPGGTIKYTLSVTNNGPDDAKNVVIEDTLPAGMTVVPKLPFGCDEALGVVTCTLPSVPVTPSPTSIMLTMMAGDDLQPIVNKVEIIGSDSEEPPTGPTGPQEDMVAGQIVAALPADGTAVIAVQKDFTDGNDETDVTLTLSCTSGDYDPTPVVVSPDNGPGYEKIFVISNIPLANNEGATCTVTEEPVDGYDAEYRCYPDASMSDTDENCEPKNNGKVKKSNFACKYSDVQMGDSNSCEIANVVAPVDVEVTKVWEIVNEGGDAYNRFVEITIGCDAEIIDGTQKGNKWYFIQNLYDDGYVDEDGKDIGMATITAMVIPEWYPTTKDPKKQKSTECWSTESGVSSAVEMESDCGDKEDPGMSVSAGVGDSCTITNTLFFEGIPTLNQYGLALMALLMLVIGMVGFRRLA